MDKFITTKWKPYTYDVWGNAKDGFEVNDRYGHSPITLRLRVKTANAGTAQEFVYASPTDKQLREALGIKPRVRLDTDGDDLTVYVEHAPTGEPLGELHCTSHESLSPIRIKTIPVRIEPLSDCGHPSHPIPCPYDHSKAVQS